MKNEDGIMMKQISKERYYEMGRERFDSHSTLEITWDGPVRYWMVNPARILAKFKKEEIDLMREVREGERGMIKHRRETRKIKDPKERYEWRNGWSAYNYHVYKRRDDWWRKQHEIGKLEKIQKIYEDMV